MNNEPTPAEPWTHDRLGREATGKHLIELLLNRYAARKAQGAGSFIMNIDASWGEGKTFFLKCLRADLQSRGYAVAYVNAWQDDNADDPLVTVMAAIDEVLSPFFAEDEAAKATMDTAKRALGVVAVETAKQVSTHLLKLATGISVETTLKRLQEEGVFKQYEVDDNALDKASDKGWESVIKSMIPERIGEHQKANQSADEFRAKTAEAIEGISERGMLIPLFVFVDELDRCRPLYAIKLLEDLKHLFAIENIVFVVATDSAQLSHSVKAIYGSDFDGRRYLRRFFDQVFVFPETNRVMFINHLFSIYGIRQESFFPTGNCTPIGIFHSWADGYGLSNRDLEQCMEIVATFVTSWDKECKIEPCYMLILIWMRYEKHIINLTRPLAIPDVERIPSSWIIKMEPYGINGIRQPGSFNGFNMLKAALEIQSTPLSSIQSFFGDLYTEVVAAERQVRFPNGMRHNAPDRTFMIEYASRVRNAGRTFDV